MPLLKTNIWFQKEITEGPTWYNSGIRQMMLNLWLISCIHFFLTWERFWIQSSKGALLQNFSWWATLKVICLPWVISWITGSYFSSSNVTSLHQSNCAFPFLDTKIDYTSQIPYYVPVSRNQVRGSHIFTEKINYIRTNSKSDW